MICLVHPYSPSGERDHKLESRCRAFRLLNGGGFHQRPEVLVDRPLLGVDGLGNTTQKHCRSGDVLASLSELWGVVPLVHDVALDLAGVTPGAARRVTRLGRNVLHRARRCRRQLVQPPSSKLLGVLLCKREGPRTWVQRGVSLHRLCNHWWLPQSVRHSALPGRTVARCHAPMLEPSLSTSSYRSSWKVVGA